MELIDKSAVVAEIERRLKALYKDRDFNYLQIKELEAILSLLDTLEVKDPYEQCVQYSSIKDGIEAHASIYSFNIESQLFPQLTKEQQALWRKEIEQACISGGDAGVTLARDQRYKENLEVKEMDFPCDENRDKELALSLQIQAYLNTASDELYGKGKPLYSKSHLEGIHECMKMWAKLHDYYFYKNTCENKEVDLEKELDFVKDAYYYFTSDERSSMKKVAKHFFELGLKAQKGE